MSFASKENPQTQHWRGFSLMMSKMIEKFFKSLGAWTAAGEVPRELNELEAKNQQVAELLIAILDKNILDGLRLEAVLQALFTLRSGVSLSESASL